MRIYQARIAPASASLADAVRRSADVGNETFSEDAFGLARAVPVLLSHLDGLVVGEVIAQAVSRGWHCADFLLDEKWAGGVNVGTPVSIGFRPFPYHGESPFPGAVRYTRVELQEISLLGPGQRPFHPGAKVTSILGQKPPQARESKPAGPEVLDVGVDDPYEPRAAIGYPTTLDALYKAHFVGAR